MDFIPAIAFGTGLGIGFTAGLLIALHQLESIIRKTRMEEAEAQDGNPFQ